MVASNEIQNSVKSGQALPLMESFYTIQGEGYHQGRAAYFIRLAGCHVGCHWCDVKESWEADKHPVLPIAEIAALAENNPSRIVIITGGEPLLYNLDPLTTLLKQKGLQTHIETSGACLPSGTWDWVCLSPKKFKEPVPEMLGLANELKMIIFNKSDFEFAEQYAQKVSNTCRLYLQPEWSKEREMIPLITEYVKNNPQWEVSLQIHKYLNIP